MQEDVHRARTAGSPPATSRAASAAFARLRAALSEFRAFVVAVRPRAAVALRGGVAVAVFSLLLPELLRDLLNPSTPTLRRWVIACVTPLLVGVFAFYLANLARKTVAIYLRVCATVARKLAGTHHRVRLALHVVAVSLPFCVAWLWAGLDGPVALLPTLLLLAVGLWILLLVERRVRSSTHRAVRRLTDVLAILLVALAIVQAVEWPLATQPAAGLLFPIGVWLCRRAWHRMCRSRSLFVRAGADIVFSVLLGVVLMLIIVWSANVFQFSPGQVALVRAALAWTGAAAGVHWAYWLASYVALATVTFTFLRRPRLPSRWHRSGLKGSVLGRSRIPSMVTGSRRVLSGIKIGLMVALLFGVAAPPVADRAWREPIEVRYNLEVQRQREAEGAIAAYTHIRQRFLSKPSPDTTSMAHVILAIHAIDSPAELSSGATDVEQQIARQVGRFQSDALDVEPPSPDPTRANIPLLGTDGIGQRVDRLHSRQQLTDLKNRQVDRFAQLATAAVASTIEIPNLGDGEVTEIVRAYLGGLVEGGPLKRLFYSFGIRAGPQVPSTATFVEPDPPELRAAAWAATVAAASSADAGAPSSPKDRSDIADTVALANQVRFLRTGAGPCQGCVEPGDKIMHDPDRGGSGLIRILR